jgi:hypothetical protein
MLARRGIELPPVRAHRHRLSTGDPASDWLTWVLRELPPDVRWRALVLGPWGRPLSAVVAADERTERIDCVPLGAPAGSRPEGLPGAALELSEIAPGAYGVVFTQGALAAALPHPGALKRLAGALSPDGYLVAEEWVGPPDLNPPPELQPLLDELAELLPRGVLQEPPSIAPRWLRPPARWLRRRLRQRSRRRWQPWLEDAGVLRAELHRHFVAVAERPSGGFLVDWVMERALEQLDAADETQMALVDLLGYLEERLLAEALLPTSWLCFLGRPRSSRAPTTPAEIAARTNPRARPGGR